MSNYVQIDTNVHQCIHHIRVRTEDIQDHHKYLVVLPILTHIVPPVMSRYSTYAEHWYPESKIQVYIHIYMILDENQAPERKHTVTKRRNRVFSFFLVKIYYP